MMAEMTAGVGTGITIVEPITCIHCGMESEDHCPECNTCNWDGDGCGNQYCGEYWGD